MQLEFNVPYAAVVYKTLVSTLQPVSLYVWTFVCSISACHKQIPH